MLQSDGAAAVLFTAFMLCLMVGAPVLGWWLGFWRPRRKAEEHLRSVAARMGLQVNTEGGQTWPTFRVLGIHGVGRVPVAMGTRSGLPVELTVQHGSRHGVPSRVITAATTVVVTGRKQLDTGGQRGVFLDYRHEMVTGVLAAKLSMPLLKKALFPETDARLVRGASWKVETTHGNAQRLEALLDADVRKRLAALPRPLLGVGFQGAAMMIQWLGVETDTAVIEQAFTIAIACLQQADGTSVDDRHA